uniref:Uncharacterized protein MANES_15G113700 n=1 Tax=Rhizophora mucronata TaxID=61149 RepID=A0A2P2JGA3_RHIMU
MRRMLVVVSARGRGGNNRKPLQRGRDLSIEAIQAVQALKRTWSSVPNSPNLDHVLRSKFSRLLKFDMIAVLRELLRQNRCLLALKVTEFFLFLPLYLLLPGRVFGMIRKEQWYKPQVSLYVDMATVLVSNGFLEQVELLMTYLKAERNLEPETEGFCSLLRTLMSFNLTDPGIVMECYDVIKALGCEPDRPTFKVLINGLELAGQSGASAIMRKDAQKYYGESLGFLHEEDEI